MLGAINNSTIFSGNGSWRFERYSPDNIDVSASATRMPRGDSPGLWGASRRSPFRYRLYEGQSLRWERWKRADEHYAQSVYLDDSGWAVLVTDGDRYQMVWAVSPEGVETTPIAVVLNYIGLDIGGEPPAQLPAVFFDVNFCQTDGMDFERSCLPFFAFVEGHRYHWLLTNSGQRLVLRLDPFELAQVVPESVEAAFLKVEAETAASVLRQLEDEPGLDLLPLLTIALRQQLSSVVPDLERRADLPRPRPESAHWCGSYCTRLQPAQMLNFSLHYIGGLPSRQDSFRFFLTEDTQFFYRHGREAALARLSLSMSIGEVLDWVGGPDDIVELYDESSRSSSHRWEYYQESGQEGLWASVCVAWESESPEARMLSIGTLWRNRQEVIDRATELAYGDSGVRRFRFGVPPPAPL